MSNSRFNTRAAAAVVLSVTTLAGCGGQSPPPVGPTPASTAVTEPAPTAGVYGDPSQPAAGRVLGTVIHTKDVEELRYVALQALTDRYADSKGITVTQAETDAYVAQMREALAKDPAVAAEPADESSEDAAARQEIAAAFIKQWKINKALHDQYGGRVIFQQGGPEPLDAYRAFLEERQAAGDFAIDDPAMVEDFWRYYRDDSIHSFFAPGSPEERQAFSVPPWAK
jgi:hypothetical protein